MYPVSIRETMVDCFGSLQLGKNSRPFMILDKLSNILAGYPRILLLGTP